MLAIVISWKVRKKERSSHVSRTLEVPVGDFHRDPAPHPISRLYNNQNKLSKRLNSSMYRTSFFLSSTSSPVDFLAPARESKWKSVDDDETERKKHAAPV